MLSRYEENRGKGAAIKTALAYIADITFLQTAFAQDMYGVGYQEELSGVPERVNALCIINGDSYGNDIHAENGTIIRNGIMREECS